VRSSPRILLLLLLLLLSFSPPSPSPLLQHLHLHLPTILNWVSTRFDRYAAQVIFEPMSMHSASRCVNGQSRARLHCRFVPPLIHFIPVSLTYSVPLFLKGQCDQTLGQPRYCWVCSYHDDRAPDMPHKLYQVALGGKVNLTPPCILH
jgi:hypothetical protein